ncbi:hypothetical protein [Halapricum desulfuricans]|uniref:hypothetical protein n=1 Tax=Halapricum desulfuricans TaxID=2841257 RepID=UPI001E4CDB76|nr:hypothetical protein [Halapricum desulfuricans]
MTEHNSAEDKSIVSELEFGSKTAKRVSWEAWEFSVEGPHQVRVTNASWGFQKDDHSYVVGIKERDGQAVPAECGCKADRYNEEYDCKHKVAIAAVGNSVVLQAALDCPTPGVDSGRTVTKTMGEKLRADGGGSVTEEGSTAALNESDPENCDCEKLPGDFPCADCYIKGRSDLLE